MSEQFRDEIREGFCVGAGPEYQFLSGDIYDHKRLMVVRCVYRGERVAFVAAFMGRIDDQANGGWRACAQRLGQRALDGMLLICEEDRPAAS